jgi:hypothetical protein
MKAVMFAAAMAIAQTATPVRPPDLSGTWSLYETRSSHTGMTVLIGLVKISVPTTIHVTHAANGTVIVESHINESQSRMYKPGAKSATPVVPNGTIAMTAKWEARTLVAQGTFESVAGSVAVREAFAIAADGRTLTVDVSIGAGSEKRDATLVYTRLKSVGSCKTWPTPCKF